MKVTAFEEDIDKVIRRSFYSNISEDIRKKIQNFQASIIDTYYKGEEYKLWYELHNSARDKMTLEMINSSEIKKVVSTKMHEAREACLSILRHEFERQFHNSGSSNAIVKTIGFLSPPGYGKTKYVVSSVEAIQREEGIIENFVFVDGLKYHTIFNPIASNLKTTTSLDTIVPTAANRKAIAGLIVKDRTLSAEGSDPRSYEQLIDDKVLTSVLSYFTKGTGASLLANIASTEISKIGKRDETNPLYASVVSYTKEKDEANNKIIAAIRLARKIVKDIRKNNYITDDKFSLIDFRDTLKTHKRKYPEGYRAVQALVYSLALALMLDFIKNNEDIQYDSEAIKNIEVLSTYAALAHVFIGGALDTEVDITAAGGKGVVESIISEIKNYVTKSKQYANKADLVVQKLYVLLQVIYDKDSISDGIFLTEDINQFQDNSYPLHSWWGAIREIVNVVSSRSSGSAFSKTSVRKMLYFDSDEVNDDPRYFGSLYLRRLGARRTFSNGEGGNTTMSAAEVANIVSQVMKTISEMKMRLESLMGDEDFSFYLDLLTSVKTIDSNVIPDIGMSVSGDTKDKVFNFVSKLNNVHSHAMALLYPTWYIGDMEELSEADERYLHEFISKYIACQFYPLVSDYFYSNLSNFADSAVALTLAFEMGIQEILFEARNKYDLAVKQLREEGKKIANEIERLKSQNKILTQEDIYKFIRSKSAKADEIIENMKLYVIILDEVLHNITRENFAILLRIWDMLLNKTDFSRPNVYVILTGNSPSSKEIRYIAQLMQPTGVGRGQTESSYSSITAENIAAFFARVDFYIVSPDYEYILRNETGITQTINDIVSIVESAKDLTELAAVDYFMLSILRKKAPNFDYFDAIVKNRVMNLPEVSEVEVGDLDKLSKIELVLKLINNRMSSLSEGLASKIAKCKKSYNREDFACRVAALEKEFKLSAFGESGGRTLIRGIIQESFKKHASDYKLMFGLAYAPILMYMAIYDTLRTIPDIYKETINNLQQTLNNISANDQNLIEKYNSALADTIESMETMINILKSKNAMANTSKLSTSEAKAFPIWLIYLLSSYKFLINMAKINPYIFNVFSSLDTTQLKHELDHENIMEIFDLVFDKNVFIQKDGSGKIKLRSMHNSNMSYVYRDITITSYFIDGESKFRRHEKKYREFLACPYEVLFPNDIVKNAVRNLARILMFSVLKMSDRSSNAETVLEVLARGIYQIVITDNNKFHISLRDYDRYITKVVDSVVGYIYMLIITKTIIEQNPDEFLSKYGTHLTPEEAETYKMIRRVLLNFKESVISYDPKLHSDTHTFHDISQPSGFEESKKFYSIEVAQFLSGKGVSSIATLNYQEDTSIYNIVKSQGDNSISTIWSNYIESVLMQDNPVTNIMKSPIAGIIYLSMIEQKIGSNEKLKINTLQDALNKAKSFITTGGLDIEIIAAGTMAKGLLSMEAITTHINDIAELTNLEIESIHVEEKTGELSITDYIVSNNKSVLNRIDIVKNKLMATKDLGWLNIGYTIKDKNDKLAKLYRLYSTNSEKVIKRFCAFVKAVTIDYLGTSQNEGENIIKWFNDVVNKTVQELNNIQRDQKVDIARAASIVLNYIDADLDTNTANVNKLANDILVNIGHIARGSSEAIEAALDALDPNKNEIGNLAEITRLILTEKDHTDTKSYHIAYNDSLFGSPLFRIKYAWLYLGLLLIAAIHKNDDAILKETIKTIFDFHQHMYVKNQSGKSYLEAFLEVVIKNAYIGQDSTKQKFVEIQYSEKVDKIDKENTLYKHRILNKYGYDKDEQVLTISLHMCPIKQIKLNRVVVGQTKEEDYGKTINLDDVIIVYSGPMGEVLNVANSKEIGISYLIDPTVDIVPRYAFAENITEHTMLAGAIAMMSKNIRGVLIDENYASIIMPFVIANIYYYYDLDSLSYLENEEQVMDKTIVKEVKAKVWQSDKPLHPWLFLFLVAAKNGMITQELDDKMTADYGINIDNIEKMKAQSNNKKISFVRYFSENDVYTFDVKMIQPYMPVFEIKLAEPS